MPTLQDYTNLIPSQNRHLTRFPRVVETLVEGPMLLTEALSAWHQKFDIDTAVGDQLDIIGEWIGFRRYLQVEITGVYFSWDDIPQLGWDYGRFKGRFEAESQMETLGDEDYRRLLKALIGINRWDGSHFQLIEHWMSYLGSGDYSSLYESEVDDVGAPLSYDEDAPMLEYRGAGARLVDNHDMTISVALLGDRPIGFDKAMIQLALNFIKPAAVGVREVFATSSGGDLIFSWDYPTGDFQMGGWDLGEWVEALDYGTITGLGQNEFAQRLTELPLTT